MTYRELIERFEKYADEEVSMIASYGYVAFFPASDGNIEIVHLMQGVEEPYRVTEIYD